MSVDTLRESFHINRVSPNDLEDFLTAQTYRPEITRAKEKIQSLSSGALQKYCDTPIRQGKSPAYTEGVGLTCIKPKNTNEMIVSLDEADTIDPSTRDEIAGQRLKSGDIVITRSGAGTIGRASLFLSDEEVYTNDHLFIVRLVQVDSHFACAFLNSFWGHRLLEAGISGSTGQLNLSNDHIKRLLLYVPEQSIQEYIGGKVRLAAQLEMAAKSLEQRFSAKVLEAVPEALDNRSTGRRHSRVGPEDISYTLNPGAFDEERLRVQRYLLASGGRRLRSLAEISTPSVSEYSPSSKYVGLDAISSSSCKLIPSTAREAEIAGTCRVLSVGPVIAKLRPYLNKVSYIPPSLEGALGSTELLCISPLKGISGWYLYGLLKSELTLKQIRPVATGATHPRIDQFDVNEIVVPLLDGQDIMGKWLQRAQISYFLSRQLTIAAVMLVEALIQGQLEEHRVISAYQAQLAGNDELDKHILGRLAADGFDGQGEALFADLDLLYASTDEVE